MRKTQKQNTNPRESLREVKNDAAAALYSIIGYLFVVIQTKSHKTILFKDLLCEHSKGQ